MINEDKRTSEEHEGRNKKRVQREIKQIKSVK